MTFNLKYRFNNQCKETLKTLKIAMPLSTFKHVTLRENIIFPVMLLNAH